LYLILILKHGVRGLAFRLNKLHLTAARHFNYEFLRVFGWTDLLPHQIFLWCQLIISIDIKNEFLFVVPAVLTIDTKNSIFCAGYLRRPISKIKAIDTKIVFLVPVG
jgi:hypothetical protein